MKSLLTLSLLACTLLTGCLTSKPGGIGSVTVPNSNVNAIIAAAQPVFAASGYTPGPATYPISISFEKPAGAFGKLLYGSYGVTTTYRVKLMMTQLQGTQDFVLTTKVARVTDAGEAGFEDKTQMLGLWSEEFKPLLEKIKVQASGAGALPIPSAAAAPIPSPTPAPAL